MIVAGLALLAAFVCTIGFVAVGVRADERLVGQPTTAPLGGPTLLLLAGSVLCTAVAVVRMVAVVVGVWS